MLTPVRPLSCVQAHVGLQVTCLAEAALTHGARVGPLAGVHAGVYFKTTFMGELHPAGVTFELSATFVTVHVDAELDSGSKRLETAGTTIRLVFSEGSPLLSGSVRLRFDDDVALLVDGVVRSVVRLQGHQINEPPAAKRARMRLELVQAHVRVPLAEKNPTVCAKLLVRSIRERVAVFVLFASAKRPSLGDLIVHRPQSF